MITAITIGLGMLNVILLLKHRDIVLFCQCLSQHVDIIYIRTDHPDSGHIEQILLHIIQCKAEILAVQLTHNTRTALQTGTDGRNRVALIPHIKFRIQHIKFRTYFFDGTTVTHPHFLIIYHRIHHLPSSFINRLIYLREHHHLRMVRLRTHFI